MTYESGITIFGKASVMNSKPGSSSRSTHFISLFLRFRGSFTFHRLISSALGFPFRCERALSCLYACLYACVCIVDQSTFVMRRNTLWRRNCSWVFLLNEGFSLLIANAMEFNLRLRKVCPRCNTLVDEKGSLWVRTCLTLR